MEDKKVTQDQLKKVEEVATKILSLMGSQAKVGVTIDEANNAVIVNLETEVETGLLIGRHGEGILSIQTVLGMIVRKTLGEWVRIVVNVGDWREKQESQLKDLALQTAARAKETGEPQYLYNLTANQRRIVHLTLSEDSALETESQGEGKERYLLVSPKA